MHEASCRASVQTKAEDLVLVLWLMLQDVRDAAKSRVKYMCWQPASWTRSQDSHTHLNKPTSSQEMEMITGCNHTPLRPLL